MMEKNIDNKNFKNLNDEQKSKTKIAFKKILWWTKIKNQNFQKNSMMRKKIGNQKFFRKFYDKEKSEIKFFLKNLYDAELQ